MDDNFAVGLVNNLMTDEQISKLYQEKEINRAEAYLLLSLKSDGALINFLTGTGSFRLPYGSSVDPSDYFTNYDQVMNAFYSMYKTHPDYNLDKVFGAILEKMTKSHFTTYFALKFLEKYLVDLRKGIATFKIDNVQNILEEAKNQISSNLEFFKVMAGYSSLEEDPTYYSDITHLNSVFKSDANYDVLNNSDDSGSRHV